MNLKFDYNWTSWNEIDSVLLDQFNFEYVWYLDANELKFVYENLEDDKAMIDELLATNKFAIICEVCHTED